MNQSNKNATEFDLDALEKLHDTWAAPSQCSHHFPSEAQRCGTCQRQAAAGAVLVDALRLALPELFAELRARREMADAVGEMADAVVIALHDLRADPRWSDESQPGAMRAIAAAHEAVARVLGRPPPVEGPTVLRRTRRADKGSTKV